MLLQLIIFHITIPYRICSIFHKVRNGVCQRLFWWWSNDINYTVPSENNVRLYVIELTSINMVWDSNEVDKTLFYFSWNRHTSGGYRGLNSHLWFYPGGQRSTNYISRSTIPPSKCKVINETYLNITSWSHEKKNWTMIVNNSININKTNNHISP